MVTAKKNYELSQQTLKAYEKLVSDNKKTEQNALKSLEVATKSTEQAKKSFIAASDKLSTAKNQKMPSAAIQELTTKSSTFCFLCVFCCCCSPFLLKCSPFMSCVCVCVCVVLGPNITFFLKDLDRSRRTMILLCSVFFFFLVFVIATSFFSVLGSVQILSTINGPARRFHVFYISSTLSFRVSFSYQIRYISFKKQNTDSAKAELKVKEQALSDASTKAKQASKELKSNESAVKSSQDAVKKAKKSVEKAEKNFKKYTKKVAEQKKKDEKIAKKKQQEYNKKLKEQQEKVKKLEKEAAKLQKAKESEAKAFAETQKSIEAELKALEKLKSK